jgi:hypothetical protein
MKSCLMHMAKKLEIYRAKRQSLARVRFHSNPVGLERYLFCSNLIDTDVPVHSAVHFFDGAYKTGKKGRFVYTACHSHDCWEVDLVIPLESNFRFQVESNGKIFVLKEKCSIVIPPGVPHRMEVLSGKGLMVCFVCSGDYNKSIRSTKIIPGKRHN